VTRTGRRARSGLFGVLAALAFAGLASARQKPLDEAWFGVAPVQQLTATAWITGSLAENLRYRLVPDERFDLLARFAKPGVDRPPEWHSFWAGRYGPRRSVPAPSLGWSASSCAERDATDFDVWSSAWASRSSSLLLEPSLLLSPPSELDGAIDGVEFGASWLQGAIASPEPALVPISSKRCPAWQRVRPVTIARYGSESDVFRLLECDGSVAPEALDRLSVLARQPGSPRPELPLPLEPQAANEFGEWLPELKLVHPRLLWALQRIAAAFPKRAIYLISGYRRDGHGSFHRQGRALDLFVSGVANTDLFRFCRTLHDVGCGYYPNNTFIHVDVRPFGTGHPMWIDVSEPGKPSEYVDAWPGVAFEGDLAWAGGE
jgi:hypothetical protein